MIGIGLVLVSLSVGDLVAGGLTGEPTRGGRLTIGMTITFGISLLILTAAPIPLGPSAALLAVATLGTATWLASKLGVDRAEARRDGKAARRWAQASLVIVGAAILTPLLFAASFHSDLPTLTAWLQGLPFPRAQDVNGSELLVLLGILLFLTSPANAIVRTLLTAARTEWRASEQKLRGGRYIGVLERWLIFGLALAGEPTAAALVVSAKSLLRFPELSQAARETTEEKTAKHRMTDIDEVTEYFLLGSLASWSLALVFVLLLA